VVGVLCFGGSILVVCVSVMRCFSWLNGLWMCPSVCSVLVGSCVDNLEFGFLFLVLAG
jgi:hypothetical protein